MLLEETTTVDAAEAFDDVEVGVFPLGSTEQHGPALPLSTDTLAAELMANSLATHPQVAVAPTIPVTVSPHHRQFYGTLWVSETTMARYLYELLESVTGHGVQKMVILNAHGGNQRVIETVAQRLYRDEVGLAVPWNWWESVEQTAREALADDVEIPGHAADVEASLMMYAAEELVREERFTGTASGQYEGSRFNHPDLRGYDFADWTDNGIHGQLEHASPEAGKAIYEASSQALTELVNWLADLPPEACLPRSHK